VRRLLLLLVLGCTSAPAREPLVLRIALWGPLGAFPSGKNPGLASIAETWVFEKLVTIDAKGELIPSLASRIDRLPGNEFRLELRSGATFSDGAPVTEDDVVRSLDSTGLRVIPEHGAVVVSSREKGIPPEALLLQAHIFKEAGGTFVGSGPFVLSSRAETDLEFARRQPEAGRINRVHLTAYAGPREAFTHTLKGDANAIVDLESRWLEFFRGVPSLQEVRGAGHSTDAIMFNPALSRQERQWLAAVLASQRVRELAYGNAECAENGGADPGPAPTSDPLRILSWGPFERLALAARRALGERGGEITHPPVQDVLARLRDRDFDLVTGRPLHWPPSMIPLVWRTGSPGNASGYSNPALDRAMEAGDSAGAAAALHDDPPAAFICTRNQLAVVDGRIRNPRLGPYELLETLPEWEVTQ
jgi:hypothetical protein